MLSRKREPTGRRSVTEAILICSSQHSLKGSGSYDSLNVSRDVTFPPNLERFLWALILSCLIVSWRSYDKQTRVVVKGGSRVGGEGFLGKMGFGCSTHFAIGSRCFHKLSLCCTRLRCEHLSERAGVSAPGSGIALNLIKVRKTVPFMSVTCASIVMSSGKRCRTDAAEVCCLWSFKYVRCDSSLSKWITTNHNNKYI